MRTKVRTLVTWWEPHSDNVLRVLIEGLAVDLLDRLIIYDTRVWVVHGAVPTDKQLRCLFVGKLALKQLAEFEVRFNYARYSFGRIEAGNLNDIFSGWPCQLVAPFLRAERPELAHVVLTIPGR